MQKWEGYQNGINIGGWLSQCVHTKEHYNSFITEEDFKKIKEMRICGTATDHVRLPVDYNVVQEKDGAFKDEGFSYIIKAAEWCSRYGLNMVLDLHKTAGYSFDAAENEHGFFESQEYQEMFYKLWEEFARVFGGNKSIAFELLNEVAEKEYCGKWNGIAGQCIGRIRKIEGSTPIIIGGYWNNSVQAVKDLPAFMDENIIYNIHCYEPYIFTHQGAEWINGMPGDFRCSIKEPLKELRHKCEEITPGLLADFDGVWDSGSCAGMDYFVHVLKEAAAVAGSRNKLLYCGEYGVIQNAKQEERKLWIEEINKAFGYYGIGRALWTYKGMFYEL
jgi:Endoglucanase